MQRWFERLYQDLATGRRGHTWTGRGILVEALHALVVLVRESRQDRLLVRAAMLAYWTAVAIVPILLIGFSLSAPLGAGDAARDAVRRMLYDTILTDSVEDVGTALDALLAAANLKALSLVGLAGIMVIGSQLYFNAELAYNDIFRTRVRRSLLLRFTLFYAGITLAPSLIAAGFVATATLPVHVGLLARVVPVLLTATALVGAIRLLPNRRVRWRSALAGGLFSAVAFEAAKFGFSAYTRLMGTAEGMAGVYGSLAFLPVFLIWLEVLWLVVLLGVEVAYLVEHYEHLVGAQRRDVGDPNAAHRRPDALFGLGLLGLVARAWLDGEPAYDADRIVAETGADPRHVQVALEVLVDGGLLLEAEDKRYVLARPPEQISTGDILRCWRQTTAPSVREDGPAAALIRQTEARMLESLDQPGAWIPPPGPAADEPRAQVIPAPRPDRQGGRPGGG